MYINLKRVPKRRSYDCDVCPKQFETPSKLARHYLTHTGQKPFRCQDCGKTFRQVVHLERHKITHTQPFQCHVCHRHFKKIQTFSKHQQMHRECLVVGDVKSARKAIAARQRKRTAVSVCRRVFVAEERQPLKHGEVCTKEQEQRCERCDKVFPSRSKLQRHLLIHTGQRPFVCAQCGRSFRQKTHLQVHQLTHAQQRMLFQCSHCLKTFKTQEKLLKHEEVHSQQIHSQNMLIRGEGLKRVKDESSEVFSDYAIPFQCSLCEQCFENQRIMNNHACFARGDMETATCHQKGTLNRGRPTKQQRKLGSALEMASDIPREAFQSIGKLLKKHHLGRVDGLLSDIPECQDRDTSLDIFPLYYQDVKVVGHDMGHAQPFMQRQFNEDFSRELGGALQGFQGNADIGTTAVDFCASNHNGPRRTNDPLRHFLQGAQGAFYLRSNVSRCDLCEKVFPSMSKLRRHYLIHTGQKPYSCTECGKKFRQSAHLKRHQVTHVRKGPLRRSRGLHEDLFQVFSQPQRHMGHPFSQIYPSNPLENIQGLGETSACATQEGTVDAETTSVSMYAVKPPRVIRKKKPRTAAPRDRVTKLRPEHPKRAKRTRASQSYKCSVCTKNFLSPSKLERHYLMHAGQRPFECSDCGKTFRQDPHLKRHQLIHFRVKD